MVAEAPRIATVCHCRGHSADAVQSDSKNVYVGGFSYIRSGRFEGQQWRPQGYGNPFKLDPEIPNRVRAAQDMVDRFEAYIARQMKQHPERLRPVLKNLIGKTLWCWCCSWDGVSQPRPLCHAAVLADWVNRMVRGEKPWEAILLKIDGTAK